MKEIYEFSCAETIPNQSIGSQQADTVLQGLGERIGVKAEITTTLTFLILAGQRPALPRYTRIPLAPGLCSVTQVNGNGNVVSRHGDKYFASSRFLNLSVSGVRTRHKL